MKKGIIFVLTLLLLSSFTGCTDAESCAPELMEPVGVKPDTAVVTRGDFFETTVYKGELIPYVEELSFAMDGSVGECFIKIGDLVEKGQVLVTLDTNRVQKQIDALEAEIAHTNKTGAYSDRIAELDIAIAEAQLEELRRIGAAAGVCKDKALEIEQRKLDLAQKRELRDLELGRKEQTLEALKNQVSGAALTAPFSGRIVYVSSGKKGSSVSAHKAVVGIVDDSRLRVSTQYITPQRIDNSDRVFARILDTDVPLRYIPMDSAEYVSKVSAGEELRSEFVLETGSERFRSGQFAAVMLINAYKENVLTVPANAIFQDEKGRYVYKIQGDERIRCNITVGMQNDVEAEVKEGLQEGDVVYVKE